MCGIIGYTGSERARDVIIEGLRKLEYRGYDSAGIAVQADGGVLDVVRRAGKVSGLADAVAAEDMSSGCGVGHTRWATHGKPSEQNAHPHVDCTGKIAVVHNGIIENFVMLRGKLEAAGHTFASETDTEVIAHLLEDAYEGDLVKAVAKVTTTV